MNKPFVLGISGGSGSGKTTLSLALADLFKGRCQVIHVDDYFKPRRLVPSLYGRANWEDPRAINLTKLAQDLRALINTKEPNLKLLIIEGFLIFHPPDLRQLIDLSLYLEAPIDQTLKRRKKPVSSFYETNIIELMHHKYVQPQSLWADVVLDVSKVSKSDLLNTVIKLLPEQLDQKLKSVKP